MVLGIRLQLLIGPFLPSPAPSYLIQAIKSLEVTNSDGGRDGFQITFTTGKSKFYSSSTNDYSLNTNNALLKPFNRVIIRLSIGALSRVLIDGFITHHQFNPSNDPGKSTFTITGEDYSLIMDMHEIPWSYPNQTDYLIVTQILLRNGIIPVVIPPFLQSVPLFTEKIPTQTSTDLKYIQELASKYNYIFYIEPTDTTGMNKGYWGPSIPTGVAQKPITFNMGSQTNTSSAPSFQYNALEPLIVAGVVQDRRLNVPLPVVAFAPLPPFLASSPAWLANLPNVRNKLFRASKDQDVLEAYIQAVSEVDKSKDVVLVSGEIDTLRYGDVLRARKLVNLRGVGNTYDGSYYVKSVTTKIQPGSCKHSFSLSREGTGPLSQFV